MKWPISAASFVAATIASLALVWLVAPGFGAEPKPLDARGRVIHVHRSPTLSTLVQPLLKESINLYRVSEAINSSRSFDEKSAIILETAAAELNADAVSLYLEGEADGLA